ncbi:hypothetical protein EAI_07831 [Harpegnathos saltator]|uniref:Uncharacterized protein n=1 Tax=Harpegnathos saltator TaxID=610380 RepID=E2BLI3_HARSA|nr:hypothetical protein EAI_07831 [Harpegnathos saltator]
MSNNGRHKFEVSIRTIRQRSNFLEGISLANNGAKNIHNINTGTLIAQMSRRRPEYVLRTSWGLFHPQGVLRTSLGRPQENMCYQAVDYFDDESAHLTGEIRAQQRIYRVVEGGIMATLNISVIR